MNLLLKIINRINPRYIWDLYSYKCRKILNKSAFILSFDCDTEKDIKVAWDVHSRLLDIGINPVYAVPGALLKIGESTYKKIFDTNAEFINHGGQSHTYFDRNLNRYASNFFYDTLSEEVIKNDIVTGHKCLQEVLGIEAKGFRTPHFGSYQSRVQLEFLYSVLNELNYSFSTSTTPNVAYKQGPAYKQNFVYNNRNIFEIPVTGGYKDPFNVFDTWGYFDAPDRTKTPQEYVKACELLAEYARQKPVFINIYGDPSHISERAEFFAGMKILVKSTTNLNYSQLLTKLRNVNENLCTIG